jgi:Ulp1 family protease
VATIFELDTLYFPLNITDTHWLLLKVDVARRLITFWDSLRWNTYGELFTTTITRYLNDEHIDKIGFPMSSDLWTLNLNIDVHVPQQGRKCIVASIHVSWMVLSCLLPSLVFSVLLV